MLVLGYMEVALTRWHSPRPIALEIVKRLDTTQATFVGELEFCVFSEARCIWVEESVSIPERPNDEFCCGRLAHELGALLPQVGNGKP